jgi:hypothetical protein
VARSLPDKADGQTLTGADMDAYREAIETVWAPPSLPGALTFYNVSTKADLITRVNAAAPGDVIGLQTGIYDFGTGDVPLRCDTNGTVANPIYLVGLEPGVHIRGPDYTTNTQLVTVQANHWRLIGLELSRCHILLWIWRGNFNVVRDCYLHHSGGSLLHIKGLSRFNLVEGCVLHTTFQNTGLAGGQPSEGIYVGSDIASWDGSYSSFGFNNGTGVSTDPDDSSFNTVRRNYISNTYTENIEFKEGTRNNVATENILDGTGLRTDTTSDSKNITCKGNYCRIWGNFIVVPGSDAISLANASDNSQGATDNRIGPNYYDYTAPYPGGTPDKKIDQGSLGANNDVHPEQVVIAGTDPGLATSLSYHRPGTQVVVSQSATYTARVEDDVVLVDASGGARTVNLPTAVGNTGATITVKKTDSSGNAVTVDPNGSQTVDGASTHALSSQYAKVTVVSDGANWAVVA